MSKKKSGRPVGILLTIMLILLGSTHVYSATKDGKMKNAKIKITVGNTVATATMYDNPTARDFVSLLPMKLKLKDYASTEKVSDLPKKLSTKDAPAGSDPSVGDITYYAPWGNLALFYKDFDYSAGLIILGKIDSGMKAFNVSGSLEATIEVVE